MNVMLGLRNSLKNMLFQFDYIAQNMASRIPFTSQNILVNNARGVALDIGCGCGIPVSTYLHRARISHLVGADIDYSCIMERNLHYNHLILADANSLPFRSKSFDTVLCMQLIYHFIKSDALRIVDTFKSLARKRIILTLPVGDTGQVWNHSIFYPAEFSRLGFQVSGHGIRLPQSIREKHEFSSIGLGFFLVRLSSLFFFTFNHPAFSHLMVCIKKIGQ